VFVLYDHPLPVADSIKHVGVLLQGNLNSMDRTIQASTRLRSCVYTMCRRGLTSKFVNPLTCLKVIKTVYLPKMLYGCELWNSLTRTENLILERSYRHVIKTIQNLHRRTRTDVVLGLLGLLPLEAEIDTRKLCFVGGLLCMNRQYLPHKVCVTRLLSIIYQHSSQERGFIPDILRLLDKYNLRPHVKTFIASGTFSPKPKWKKLVRKSVFDYHRLAWRERIDADYSLRTFSKIHPSLTVHPAWYVAKENPAYRASANFLVKCCAVIRDMPDVNTLCERCGNMYSDPITHAMARCDYLQDSREEMWLELINVGPIEFSAYLHSLSSEDFTICVLSCRPYFTLETADTKLFAEIAVRYTHRLCKELYGRRDITTVAQT